MEKEETKDKEVKIYWQRWYILALFSLFTMEQCAVWNTFGPIAASAKKVYGFSDSTITLYNLWGCLGFLIFFLPSVLLLKVSLRYSVVAGTSCMLIASSIRCLPLLIPGISDTFTGFCMAGAIINAIAGPVAMAAPIQISATWFPPHERTRATSIGQMFNALGVGVSFLLGTAVSSVESGDLARVERDIELLIYFHAGASIVISLLIYAYFPSEPPSPPSVSATQERTSFVAGLKAQVRNKNGWLIMIVYAISQGLVQTWQSSMVINLTSPDLSQNVSETFASTLGVIISFVAVAASIAVATLMDYFRKKMKLAILILLALSGTIFIFCTLLTEDIIVFDDHDVFKGVISTLLIIGISLSCSCAPIAFEFCVELCYPIAEGTIGTWLTVWFNVVAVGFFLVFQIPDVGTRWLNYTLAPSVLLPIPLLLLVKEQYKRGELDG